MRRDMLVLKEGGVATAQLPHDEWWEIGPLYLLLWRTQSSAYPDELLTLAADLAESHHQTQRLARPQNRDLHCLLDAKIVQHLSQTGEVWLYPFRQKSLQWSCLPV